MLTVQKAGTTTSHTAVAYKGEIYVYFVGENGYIQFVHQDFPPLAGR